MNKCELIHNLLRRLLDFASSGAALMAAPEPRPSRRLFRTSTRGLMLLVLVIGVLMGWMVNRARVQRDGVAAVRRAGGSIRFLHQYDYGQYVDGTLSLYEWLWSFGGVDSFDTALAVVCPSSIVDADLIAVGRLRRPESVELREAAAITDEGLRHLSGLSGLKHLGMSRTQVTSRGLAHLARLTTLESLNLNGTQVDGDGLKHLRGLTILQSLDLSGTRVDGAGLKHLRGLVRLKELHLGGTRVDGPALAHLRGLVHLQRLDLDGTRVDGAAMEHLRGLTELHYLSLMLTDVDDAGLERLQGLTNLETIRLGETLVTDDGLEALAASPRLHWVELFDPTLDDAVCTDDDPRITDAGLARLIQLPRLVRLSLAGSRLTEARIDGLQELRPYWISRVPPNHGR